MEMREQPSLSSVIEPVKIRPFRYGNIYTRKIGRRSFTQLKSDRFGMEIIEEEGIVWDTHS